MTKKLKLTASKSKKKEKEPVTIHLDSIDSGALQDQYFGLARLRSSPGLAPGPVPPAPLPGMFRQLSLELFGVMGGVKGGIGSPVKK